MVKKSDKVKEEYLNDKEMKLSNYGKWLTLKMRKIG
jgi:hypothetical protein